MRGYGPAMVCTALPDRAPAGSRLPLVLLGLPVLLFAAGCGDKDGGGQDSAAADDSGVGDGGTDGDTGESGPDCSGGSGWDAGGQLFETDGMSAYRLVPGDLAACAPVVVFCHGGNNAGSDQDGNWLDVLGTNLGLLAGERSFVLVVPGVQDGGGGEHNWSLDHPDELAALVELVGDGVDVDRSRVLLMGQSAGGHITAYTALYEPGPFTAAGVVSAGIGSYFDYPDTEPDPKLPFYVAHDPADEVVAYSRSEALAADLEAHGHDYVFVDWELGANGHGWDPELSVALLDWFEAL